MIFTQDARGGAEPSIETGADRLVDLHLAEPLRPVLHRSGGRRESLARLLDDLTRIVDDAPAPERMILRGRDRHDLHAPTTDSGAWRAPPSASTRPVHGR